MKGRGQAGGHYPTMPAEELECHQPRKMTCSVSSLGWRVGICKVNTETLVLDGQTNQIGDKEHRQRS